MASKNNVRWRTVALPTEHGGWGFISEPVILGLLLAPGWGGLALSIAALAAFLLRQPLRIYLKDVQAGRSVPRTLAARRFVLLYGGIMLAAGGALLLMMASPLPLLPLLLALPFVIVQLGADLRNRSRTLVAEIAGALATSAIVSAIVLIEGWALSGALALWLVLAAKGATAIVYVRERLRLQPGETALQGWAIPAHGVGLVALLALVGYRLVSWTAPLGMAVLLARAIIGLSALRKEHPARVIGMQEIGYGLAFVLLVALGYLLPA